MGGTHECNLAIRGSSDRLDKGSNHCTTIEKKRLGFNEWGEENAEV